MLSLTYTMIDFATLTRSCHYITTRLAHGCVGDNVLGVVSSVLQIDIQIQKFGVPLHERHQCFSLQELSLAIKLLPSMLQGEVCVPRSYCRCCASRFGLLEHSAKSKHVLNLLRRHSKTYQEWRSGKLTNNLFSQD